jgi:hypothetical protein
MALANGKYKGKSLSLLVNSIEYNMDASSVTLENEDGKNDVVTFADVAAGGSVQWFFTIDAVADYATGSLWNYIWANAGATAIAFTFKPYGGTASATKPWFTGTLSVGAKPPVGGTADEVFKFTVRFDVIGTPTMVIV